MMLQKYWWLWKAANNVKLDNGRGGRRGDSRNTARISLAEFGRRKAGCLATLTRESGVITVLMRGAGADRRSWSAPEEPVGFRNAGAVDEQFVQRSCGLFMPQ
jgi:hypothetical protein